MQFKCKRKKELLTIALLLGDGQIPSFTTNAPKLVLKEAPVGFFISKHPCLWPQIHLHSAAFWFRKKPVSPFHPHSPLSPKLCVCWGQEITVHSHMSSPLHSGSPMTKNEYFDVIASGLLYYLLITTWKCDLCFWWDFYALLTINMENTETKFCFKFKQFCN